MDTAGPLESIAKTLPGMPPEAVESMLVTFDTLVSFSDPGQRPMAAQFLRDAAALCQNPASSERLLRAADAVAANQPCALTPEGLTWQQAAAAQTMSMEEWKARPDLQDLPEVRAEAAEPLDDLDDEEEDLADDEEINGELPELPHLRVQHFFAGLTLRVRREFADANGRLVPAGQILHVLNVEHLASCGGHTLACTERTVPLSPHTSDFDAIVENAGNAWLQPVPSLDWLDDLWDLVEDRLCAAEDLDEENELLEPIREDVEESKAWLDTEGDRGPAPECTSARQVVKFFGRDSEMAAWVPLLFAGMAACGERN